MSLEDTIPSHLPFVKMHEQWSGPGMGRLLHKSDLNGEDECSVLIASSAVDAQWQNWLSDVSKLRWYLSISMTTMLVPPAFPCLHTAELHDQMRASAQRL